MKSQSELAQKRNDPGREMRNFKTVSARPDVYYAPDGCVAVSRTDVARAGGEVARR